MIKFLKITSTVILTLFTFITLGSVSYAQTSDSAAKYGVTFPIATLGNCTDLNSCKTFCNDPINKNTCIAFAKSKGFYQEDALATQKEAVLTKAKATLGCDSATSCLNFCQIPINYDKCSTFAQSNNLQGGVIQKPDSNQILEKARQVLGCTSVGSCQSLCNEITNQQKCADFAKQTGLSGGEQKIGPGGCTSEETCRTFCSDPGNYQICASFVHSSGGTFSGPGGCNSAESCKSYCQQNPSACPNSGGTNSQSELSPAEICNRTPNCSWTGATCYCGANTNANLNDQANSDNAATTCVRYGCTYTGNSCQCQNIGNTYNLDEAKQGCELGKGTWTGSYCNMSSDSSPYSGGASYQQQEAVCKSGGGICAAGSTTNFCNCQGYQAPQYSPNPQSCQPPSGGCGANSYYDYSRCGCYQNSQTPQSNTPSSGSCQPPSGGCGPNSYYDYSRCGCYMNNSTNNSASSPNAPYDQQKALCESGGGTCAYGSSTGFCGCQGYHSSNNNAPNNNSGNSSCQPPSGGCGPNSYYDYSRCGCYQNNQGSGSNTSTTPPPSTLQPAPAQTNPPQQSNNPSTPQPSPAVQGVSTTGDFWTFLRSLFSR